MAWCKVLHTDGLSVSPLDTVWNSSARNDGASLHSTPLPEAPFRRRLRSSVWMRVLNCRLHPHEHHVRRHLLWHESDPWPDCTRLGASWSSGLWRPYSQLSTIIFFGRSALLADHLRGQDILSPLLSPDDRSAWKDFYLLEGDVGAHCHFWHLLHL